jgi:hypothetical protein
MSIRVPLCSVLLLAMSATVFADGPQIIPSAFGASPRAPSSNEKGTEATVEEILAARARADFTVRHVEPLFDTRKLTESGPNADDCVGCMERRQEPERVQGRTQGRSPVTRSGMALVDSFWPFVQQEIPRRVTPLP